MDFPEPSVFYGKIRRYSFTFKVPTNYKPQEHSLIIKVCSANGQITGAQTAVCVSGVTLYSGKYASMYNWDRAAAERADGIQPFRSIEIGGVTNSIGPASDGQTFDISTEKEVKFHNYIRATQGINLGGNANQQWGHMRFTDGNRGIGYYVNNSNGWHLNPLGEKGELEMEGYKELQAARLQGGEPTPFLGKLFDLERRENGVFIPVPADMLHNAGIPIGVSEVEVWREIVDGTICFRIATLCEICGRGSKLYELDMGFAKKNICADDYFKLTGKFHRKKLKQLKIQRK